MKIRMLLALFAAAAAATAFAGPADRFAGIEIQATHVAGPIHMLQGAGGNIGVSVGEDGVLMIDDQFAPLAERIAAAIKTLGGGLPKLVLNTHFHGDHVGGNAFFGGSGVVVAHDNVRLRLVAGDLPSRALPVVTYRDRLRLFFNGDEIDVVHLPRGHTDGDSVVWFKNANVIHMGDHFFNGRFPFVDVDNGGSVDGLLANLRAVQDMIPADARIIPGHGALGDVAALAEAADVVEESARLVREAMANGTLDDLERKGFGRWPEWGSGFISESRWIHIVARSERTNRGGGD